MSFNRRGVRFSFATYQLSMRFLGFAKVVASTACIGVSGVSTGMMKKSPLYYARSATMLEHLFKDSRS